MRLEVRKVHGMPFVKVPLGHIMTLYPCNVRLIEGKFGPSLAIFLDQCDPEIRVRLEEMEDKLFARIYDVKEKWRACWRRIMSMSKLMQYGSSREACCGLNAPGEFSQKDMEKPASNYGFITFFSARAEFPFPWKLARGWLEMANQMDNQLSPV